MTVAPYFSKYFTNTCSICGERWWDVHVCPKNADDALRALDLGKKQVERNIMTADECGDEIKALFESMRQARQKAQSDGEALKGVIVKSELALQRAVLAEREACARLCEHVAANYAGRYDTLRATACHCANLIRARGAS